MRNNFFYISAFIFLLPAYHAMAQGLSPAVASVPETAYDIDTLPIGDLNNDKLIDTAFVRSPKFINEEDGWGDCTTGRCKITVSFSCGLPDIVLDNAVSGFVENIGDINNDGNSEIIIVPGWFIGCHGNIHFFSLKKGQWKAIGKAYRNICDEESFLPYIKKMKGNKIKIMEEVWEDGDAVEKPKIITVN
jgi:hypothetical protein